MHKASLTTFSLTTLLTTLKIVILRAVSEQALSGPICAPPLRVNGQSARVGPKDLVLISKQISCYWNGWHNSVPKTASLSIRGKIFAFPIRIELLPLLFRFPDNRSPDLIDQCSSVQISGEFLVF